VSRIRRLAGFPYIGRFQYFLTFCTRGRACVFNDPDVAVMTIEQIRTASASESFEILAYCVMPDHVHLLIEGRTADADLPRFVKRAKQHSGAAYALTHGAPLWQAGYHDHVLRRNEDALDLARYILANPVREGLVSRADDYAFSGSDRWPLKSIV